jgi:hypothetical protein
VPAQVFRFEGIFERPLPEQRMMSSLPLVIQGYGMMEVLVHDELEPNNEEVGEPCHSQGHERNLFLRKKRPPKVIL